MVINTIEGNNYRYRQKLFGIRLKKSQIKKPNSVLVSHCLQLLTPLTQIIMCNNTVSILSPSSHQDCDFAFCTIRPYTRCYN